MQPQPRLQFSVYVIESNRPSEIQEGLNEGAALAKALTFARIPCQPIPVKDKQSLWISTTFGTDIQMMRFGPGLAVHFSGHGCENGVELTSREFVTWQELASMLGPLQVKTNGSFLLAMSCCKGIFAARGLSAAGLKCEGVVGPSEDVSWPDNVVAFISFYHHLAKGTGIQQAVEAMKVASGNPKYQFISMRSR